MFSKGKKSWIGSFFPDSCSEKKFSQIKSELFRHKIEKSEGLNVAVDWETGVQSLVRANL